MNETSEQLSIYEEKKLLCVSFVVSICFFGLYNKLAYFERREREREKKIPQGEQFEFQVYS